MKNNINLDFDAINRLIKDLEISTAHTERVLRKAAKVIKDEVEKATPVQSGRLKKGLKTKLTRIDGDPSISVQYDDKTFWDIFQEFGTSSQRKNIGFFSKAVNRAEREAVKIIEQEIFKSAK